MTEIRIFVCDDYELSGGVINDSTDVRSARDAEEYCRGLGGSILHKPADQTDRHDSQLFYTATAGSTAKGGKLGTYVVVAKLP